MKLLKGLSLVVAAGGLAVLVAAAASGSGREAGELGAAVAQAGSAQTERPGTPARERRPRELTVLAGRGAEIGLSVRDIEPSDKNRTGVVVEEVRADSAAEKAGLKRSDVIVEFDGEAVRSARQFARIVQETPPGRTVTASVLSGGAKKNVQITPTEGGDTITIDTDRIRERVGDAWHMAERLPPFNFDFDVPYPFDGRGRLGVSVDELTPQLAAYFGVKNGGVLVTGVTDDMPGSRAGLKAGDVITKVNDVSIHSREELVRQLREVKEDGQVSIAIVRDKKEMAVSAKLEPRTARRGRPV
jgi:membrane-associated protease RseP (regulator of RpoE activity)